MAKIILAFYHCSVISIHSYQCVVGVIKLHFAEITFAYRDALATSQPNRRQKYYCYY